MAVTCTFDVVSSLDGFGGADDFDLELVGSRTLDGNTQELTYRPARHG